MQLRSAPTWLGRGFAATALLSALFLTSSGCSQDEENKKRAQAQATKVAETVERDVAQIRSGLPVGAKKLGEILDKYPDAEPNRIQEAIVTTRTKVPDLEFAKSTFFSLADRKGLVLKSEADTDRLVDKNVFTAFPDLAKSAAKDSGIVEVFGEMDQMRGLRKGPDLAWVLGHPVPGPEDEPRGVFITGWSFRSYVHYLEDATKRSLREEAEKIGEKNAPLVYVYLVKAGKAYGAPVSAEVNAKAIEDLDVVEKAKSGSWVGIVPITGREYGIAVQKVSSLGDDAAVAVLLSVL